MQRLIIRIHLEERQKRPGTAAKQFFRDQLFARSIFTAHVQAERTARLNQT